MKTITFIFLTIFSVVRLYSQSYEIDFAGAGDTTVVDSVIVKNLDQGISLTLKGNDILKLNIPTGVPLIYELDEALKPQNSYYLGNEEEIQKSKELFETEYHISIKDISTLESLIADLEEKVINIVKTSEKYNPILKRRELIFFIDH